MSSKIIYDNFKPTFLIIKQHKITKKLYLHKTIRKDPIKYLGSGVHWVNHIKYHGIEYVETLWFCLYTDKYELIKMAELLSSMYDIVKSTNWLNDMIETGLGGGAVGQCKDMLTVRDLNGNHFKVDKNDVRLISGQLVPNMTGYKHTEKTKLLMSINRKNGLWSRSENIRIFNQSNEIVYEFVDGWNKNRKIYDLPKKLYDSFLSNGTPIKMSHSDRIKFNGWYAKKF